MPLRSALRTCVHQGRASEFLSSLSDKELRFIQYEWSLFAHEHQLPPSGNWSQWLLMGGRGAGKTRAGSEWVRALALEQPWATHHSVSQIALVGQTYGDVREVMVEGVSGLLAVHRKAERPTWNAGRRRLEWPNGVVARAFSSEDPEALRGPQFDCAWCDEVGKWSNASETFDMLQFGLRLGEHPRQLLTTTPRPIALIKQVLQDEATVMTRASTKVNAAFLAPRFLEVVSQKYGGTRLGRQELGGELIEDREDQLFLRKWFEATRLKQEPELVRVVVAVDPPATSGKRADACGIVACGLDEKGDGYILRDRTVQGVRPREWASRAVSLYHELQANVIVAEVNQGGEMVREILGQVDASVPVKCVHASRSKQKRAEPVALLYEQGRVRHVGVLDALEDEMADFGPGGLSNGRSPDRLDALVWAVSDLMLGANAGPRLRSL
ncbi:DNA-packaging protein [Flexibacterium corallicola]|uniref:DNA-packaging protein n=1 Tax=Flexibacterium corallicola TaxID=3037259 RepID=UPI00286F1B05|nr:terminase family protein [Pseudovibrio sp. M1P-2-3]